MGKDKLEKKDKKEKKEKRSEKDGVVKSSKKEKKSKLNGDNIAAAFEEVSKETEAPVVETKALIDSEGTGKVVIKPVGALVPFANPLADEKVTKKVLKSVKKGMAALIHPQITLHWRGGTDYLFFEQRRKTKPSSAESKKSSKRCENHHKAHPVSQHQASLSSQQISRPWMSFHISLSSAKITMCHISSSPAERN
jgi:hypothetical protein